MRVSCLRSTASRAWSSELLGMTGDDSEYSLENIYIPYIVTESR